MTLGTTSLFRHVFGSLEPDIMEKLHDVAVRRQYPPQTLLCRQGAIEHTFYVVVSGTVIVNQVLENGEERLLNMVGPLGYFGEMGLIDNAPRMANVITLTHTTVMEVTEEAFDQFIEQSPVLAYSVLRTILANTRRMDEQNIADLQEKNKALEDAYMELKEAQASLVEKERMDREIELAAIVQRGLLPNALPQVDGYAFAAYLQPARQVGGDFYDVLLIDEEHVGLLIADVADKGFHAAMFMAVTRTLFLQASKHSLSPAVVALAVHEGMLEVAPHHDTFVTAFYGVLHLPTGKLTYVRAAQERPFWFRPQQGVTMLTGNGRFLGLLPDLALTEETITLQSGDRLVLYSDGVPDAINRNDEHFGLARLEEIVRLGGGLNAYQFVDRLADEVVAWCRGAQPFDDLAFLVVEVQ